MHRPPTSFQLGDVITGEPHAHYAHWRTDHRAFVQRELRAGELPANTGVRMLPRIAAACGAAALLVWIAGYAAADDARSAPCAGCITSTATRASDSPSTLTSDGF